MKECEGRMTKTLASSKIVDQKAVQRAWAPAIPTVVQLFDQQFSMKQGF